VVQPHAKEITMSSPSKIRVILIIAIVTFPLSMSALWFKSVANANPRLASVTEAVWLPLILKSYPDPSPTPTATPSTQPPAIPAFDHIFIIVEENHAYSQIIGNSSAPYINSLANQHGLATNYFAIMNPSLPNYLTLTGGSNFGISNDCTTCFVNAPNIVDRLENAGKSWKAYMESMPSACFVGDAGTLYRQKHNPFVYYDNIRTDPARCNKIVPYSQLAGDLAQTSTTPNYVWITPNMCNDMHDCSVITGDTWLKNKLPMIFNSPAWTTQNSLLLITWDEGNRSDNQVATLVIGSAVIPGVKSSASYDHYSLLRTVEEAWGLPPLTTHDGNATPMTDFWH
jgi:hypothetical protein